MGYQLVITSEAEADLQQSADWYETQEQGLGDEFLQAASIAIDDLATNPKRFAIRNRRKEIRFAYTDRFPYRIVFRVTDDLIIVFAVTHMARHDREWKRKI